MRKLIRLEQLEYLKWFLKEQIKNYEEDLKEVEEEIMKLERSRNNGTNNI